MLLLFPSPKFHSVLLYDQPFLWYRTFYYSLSTTMLNGPNRTNFGRDSPPGVYINFVSKYGAYFQWSGSFKTFSPIWSHVNEKEKKGKNPNSLNNFGRDHPCEYVWILGVNLVRTFERCRLNFFPAFYEWINIGWGSLPISCKGAELGYMLLLKLWA